MTESTTDTAEVSIPKEVDAFIREVEALHTSLPFAMTMLSFARGRESEKLNTFLEKYGTLKEADDDKKIFTLTHEHISQSDRIRRGIERFERGARILPHSFLVALVSQYDYFLGRLLRCLFYLKPELLHSSERSLGLQQLLDLGSIDQAREYLIEKEVETLLRKSHAEQFEWLESKFGMPLRKGLDSWPTFIELTERRNLFVHCNGVVSSQYLLVTQNHKVEHNGDTPCVGDQLKCPPAYFRQSYECVFEIGVKLAQVLWRKIRPDQIAEADRNVMDISFELLLSEEYSLLGELLEFVEKNLKRFSSDEIRRILRINHALSHKWRGNNEKAQEVVALDDWSACSDKFQLAVAVISDEFDSASEIMDRIGVSDEVPKEAYREWPLFKEFRDSKQFLATYQKLFGEAFAVTEEIRSPDDEDCESERIGTANDPKKERKKSKKSKARDKKKKE